MAIPNFRESKIANLIEWYKFYSLFLDEALRILRPKFNILFMWIPDS